MTTDSTLSKSALRRRISAAATVLVAASGIAIGALGAAAPAAAVPPGTPTPPRPVPPQYVYIAFSPDNGDYGWANGKTEEQMALNEAMGNCRSAGGDQCKIVVTAKSSGSLENGCAALYVSPPTQFGNGEQGKGLTWGPPNVGTGATIDAAEAAATNPAVVFATGLPIVVRCATGDDGIGAPVGVGCAPAGYCDPSNGPTPTQPPGNNAPIPIKQPPAAH
jgi:hypothetical protein